MKIITIAREADAPSPHITFLDTTPEVAAMTVQQRFNQNTEIVYQLGRRIFVPITKPDEFWEGMQNGV
jgi:hypothetical protein